MLFMGKLTISTVTGPFSSSQTVTNYQRLFPINTITLVGEFPFLIHPNYWEKLKSHVPNHQPGYYIISYLHTIWGPPVVSWFINPMNTIVISTINHRYWSYNQRVCDF